MNRSHPEWKARSLANRAIKNMKKLLKSREIKESSDQIVDKLNKMEEFIEYYFSEEEAYGLDEKAIRKDFYDIKNQILKKIKRWR